MQPARAAPIAPTGLPRADRARTPACAERRGDLAAHCRHARARRDVAVHWPRCRRAPSTGRSDVRAAADVRAVSVELPLAHRDETAAGRPSPANARVGPPSGQRLDPSRGRRTSERSRGATRSRPRSHWVAVGDICRSAQRARLERRSQFVGVLAVPRGGGRSLDRLVAGTGQVPLTTSLAPRRRGLLRAAAPDRAGPHREVAR